jgi:hypothetical protein
MILLGLENISLLSNLDKTLSYLPTLQVNTDSNTLYGLPNINIATDTLKRFNIQVVIFSNQ